MKLDLNDTFNKSTARRSGYNKLRAASFEDAAFSYVTPKKPCAPKLVHASPQMLEAVGLTEPDAKSEEFLKVFSGQPSIRTPSRTR